MRNIFSIKPEKIYENSKDMPMQILLIRDKHLGLISELWLIIISYLSVRDLNSLISVNHYFSFLGREGIRVRATSPSYRPNKFFNIRLALIQILISEIRDSDTDAALNNSIFQVKVFDRIPIKMLAEWPKEEAKKFGDFLLYMQKNLKNPRVLNYIYAHVQSIHELLKEKGIEEVRLHISRVEENIARCKAGWAFNP